MMWMLLFESFASHMNQGKKKAIMHQMDITEG
jgi:hypothetical protein